MESVSHVSGRADSPLHAGKNVQGSDESFQDTLSHFLGEVNGLVQDANATVEGMASGEVTNLHQVMIAVEKASVGLEFVVEIRNKLLEAYREFMRMQV